MNNQQIGRRLLSARQIAPRHDRASSQRLDRHLQSALLHGQSSLRHGPPLLQLLNLRNDQRSVLRRLHLHQSSNKNNHHQRKISLRIRTNRLAAKNAAFGGKDANGRAWPSGQCLAPFFCI